MRALLIGRTLAARCGVGMFFTMLLAVVLQPPAVLAQEPVDEPAAQSAAAESPVAATGESRAEQVHEVGRKMGDGEICQVCGTQVYGNEVVRLRFRGRTFYVMIDMLDEFAADPETYFRSLEAHAGLFDESAMPKGQLGMGWFLFGLYVVLGLASAALCGAVAVTRGLAPLPWFFAGLVGNVAAVVVLMVAARSGQAVERRAGLTKPPSTRQQIACPGCGATLHPAARDCAKCGTSFAPSIEPETARV